MSLKKSFGILITISAILLTAYDVYFYMISHHDISQFLGFLLTGIAFACLGIVILDMDKKDKEMSKMRGDYQYLEEKILDVVPELKNEDKTEEGQKEEKNEETNTAA